MCFWTRWAGGLVPANAAQLWAERNSFLQAYWGFFGGVNVPLADWAYVVFNLIGGLSLLIGLVYLIVAGVRRVKPARWWWPVAVTLVWMVLTFIAYLRWTAITPASQGRLVFGALSSISVWMAVGLCWPLRRWGRPYLASGAVGYFAAVSLLTPFVLINPIYSPLPPPEQTVETDVIFRPVDGDGAVMLTGAAVQSEAVQPDEYVFADMNWQLETELDRNWSLFVHLETPEGVIIAQRDMYPGRGLLATSDMTAGRAWQNPVAVDVPRGAYASGELNVMVGWYHLPTGERMQLPDGGERVHIGTVTVEPRESELDVPNPLSVSFDDRIEMVGYEYSTLTPAAGEDMQVTLYWRALEPMETDYVVFVHVIDPATWSIVGTSDAQPANWTRPTTTWEVGEIIEDTHTFTINDDAPAMPYEVEVGIYSQQPDGTLQRLRVFAENGGMPNDYIYLSRVRVMPEDDNGGGSQ